MLILYRMASLILATTLIGMLLSSIWMVTVNGSRADLGTYLHIKELPGTEEKIAVDSYVLAYINYTYNTTEGKEVHFSEEKARYGEGRIMNVQGHLVHITSENDLNDHTGCRFPLRGTRGNPLPGPGKPWIALIKRGMCTFEEKIKNAWRQRAVGVIVYNEENSISLEKMRINEKERNITAVFTYKYIGEEMAKIVEDGHFVWLSIREGQRGMKPIGNINKTSVLFVSISFIVLMIISLVWLIFYYVQRFRYLQTKDQHSRHLCTVAKRIIMKIPTKNGKNDDKDSDNDCCAICIEPYKATDCIRVLPCKHEFHKNCIDPWLLEHRTCPMCKMDVLKHYGFVFIGSQESILQLDLDMEIGGVGLGMSDGGLHSSEDDRLSVDNIQINTTPTFHVQHNLQQFSNNNSNNNNINNRRNSIESIPGTISRDNNIIPERSQSSLSHINQILDETITNKIKLYHQNAAPTSATDKVAISTTKSSNSKFLSPFSNHINGKRDMESISLPGTLRKKRATTDSLRGSNNCYIKTTMDFKNLAAKIEKGCPKSKTTVIIRQSSDGEYLLANEKMELDDEQNDDNGQFSYADVITIQIDNADDNSTQQQQQQQQQQQK